MVRRIAVWRESSLGDVLLCEPIVDALAQRYPTAAIEVVTRRPYHPLFSAHPAVARVRSPNDPALAEGLAGSAGEPVDLPVDLAVDLQNRVRTRWAIRGARWRRHWRKRRGWAGARSLLGGPLHRDYRGGPHQIERMARDLGLVVERRPILYLHPAWIRAAQAWIPPTPYAVLVPCAGRTVKTWPVARFAEVGAALASDGLAILSLGGPGEDAILQAAVRHIGTPVPGTIGVGEAAAVLAGAQVVISGDTGFAHVAAAVGTPVVTVFGPTPPGRWGVARGQGTIVAKGPDCAPCSDHGSRPCRFGHRACLTELPSAPVVAAARHWVR